MPRVVLLLPTATYRAADFLAAAQRLGIEVIVGSEEPQTLAPSLLVPFDDPEEAAEVIVAAAKDSPVDAVVAVDEPGVVPAALAAERLGLAHNAPAAAMATRDKALMRDRFAVAGVPQPAYVTVSPGDDVRAAAELVGGPVVVKPVSLAASKGVIRADSPEDAEAAAARVRMIAGDPDARLLIEGYAPGAEVAVEGLLRGGRLDLLAVFDKPDTPEGPYFAETLLVTPSRLDPAVLADLAGVVAEAAAALGLLEGPIHAEARVDGLSIKVLELAARSIGGLCSRTLRFGTGMSLEELILRHAAGLPIESLDRQPGAAGVAMLYAPAAGVVRAVEGREAAAAVEGVEEIEITVRPGTTVVPIPDDARYLGFVFARGVAPAAVEHALREAVGRIAIVVSRS